MYLTRRYFVKAFSAVVALLSTKPVEVFAAPAPVVVKPEQPIIKVPFVDVPDWCPKGFLPVMGQTVGPEQFPLLFAPDADALKIKPKWRALFQGKQSVTLDKSVRQLTMIQMAGWQDNYTRTLPLDPDQIHLSLIAVDHMKRSNGKPMLAGFYINVIVSREKFEVTYGEAPIVTSGQVTKRAMYSDGFNGYETIA